MATIDLLLTDIVMPGVNGRALADRLLQSIADLKVLYTSGYMTSGATLQAVRAPSAAFIQKPYSPDALARQVRSVSMPASIDRRFFRPPKIEGRQLGAP